MENTLIDTNKVEKENQPKEYNKVPFWTMRVASGVIDVGLLFFLLFVFISLFRLTPLGDMANGYQNEVINLEKDYSLKQLVEGHDETYATKIYIDETNKDQYIKYRHYEDEDKKVFVLEKTQVEDKELAKQLETAFKNACQADKKYKNARFNYRLVNYGIEMISVATAEAILILAIPLISKRRVTIGQYIAGIRLMNEKTPTPAYWWKIIIRYLWVVVIEIALPSLTIASLYSIIIVPIILYVISLANKEKRTLRDYISSTRFIDSKTFRPLGSKQDLEN